MIIRQIPSTYLEGFTNLLDVVGTLHLPAKPDLIFTSNAFQFDEVFQAWIADKTQAGAYLVIGQHGGFYGLAKNSAPEDHQVRIADRFLTWGWHDKRLNTYPLFCLTAFNIRPRKQPIDGDLLLITTPWPPFTNYLSSFPLGLGQSRKHFIDQLELTNSLGPCIQEHLVWRIHESADKKYGTNYITEWRTKFPKINIDYSTEPIEKKYLKTRLVVYTYNSTGYLETFARNIPTIIFWNDAHWELRETAVPYFEKLMKAKIFFSDPLSAACHINEIWGDILQWWTSEEVQLAVSEFCYIYARRTKTPQEDILVALNHRIV
jgi:putative transferase (TIGR04331 family)